MNPLVTFFVTLESALIDTLFVAEPSWAALPALQRETGLGILRAAVRAVANDDIEAFCSLCQRRGPLLRKRAAPSRAAAQCAKVG